MDTTAKLVRLMNGLPLTGLVLGEAVTFDGNTALLKVAVFGYNPDKPEYWRKSDCRALTPDECNRFNVPEWLALAERHNPGCTTLI